jgi:hypothetical protein
VQLVVQRAHDRTRYLAARAATTSDLPTPDEGSGATADEVARTAEQAFQHLLAQAQRVTGRRIMVEASPTIPAHGQVQVNDLVTDLDVAEVRKAGQVIPLTPNERKSWPRW